jgi:hypothetical protein
LLSELRDKEKWNFLRAYIPLGFRDVIEKFLATPCGRRLNLNQQARGYVASSTSGYRLTEKELEECFFLTATQFKR